MATAIRYMIICRRFKHAVLMALTQQMIVEGLKFYSHRFDQLDKFPRMTSILKTSLEYDKQFYKLNYVNDYPLLLPAPSPDCLAVHSSKHNLMTSKYIFFFKKVVSSGISKKSYSGWISISSANRIQTSILNYIFIEK